MMYMICNSQLMLDAGSFKQMPTDVKIPEQKKTLPSIDITIINLIQAKPSQKMKVEYQIRKNVTPKYTE